MCDQTEVNYKEGDVVWVKLGCYFWPGEVQDVDKLDEEILVSFKKKPIAAVKFFDEDKYEYVKNLSQICLYNCRKKHDYIKKGLDMYRKQKEGSYMDKFPDDVRKAELRTGGDPDILSDAQFQPQEKPNYQGLFGREKKGRNSISKQVSPVSTNGRKSQPATPVRNPPRLVTITHPRFVKGETEHKVHIRQQPISTLETGKSPPASTSVTAAYQCQLCDFTSNRLNVIVLHNKFHSANSPSNNAKGKNSPTKIKTSSPKVRANTASAEAKSKSKPKAKSPSKEPEALSKIVACGLAPTPKVSSPPKVSAIKRKVLVEESAVATSNIEGKRSIVPESPEKKKPKVVSSESQEKKKQKVVSGSPVKKTPTSPEKSQDTIKSPVSAKRKGSRGDDKAAKKFKNDEEIREKLLADWDDEDAEQEEKEMELLKQKLLKGDNGTASHSNEISAVSKSDETKAASCFDFDDSKDAILDSELEERAKKFVENRKVPRVIDEKTDKVNNKQVGLVESPITKDSSASQPETEEERPASAEDFDKAINSLLEETVVPKLPEVPMATSEPCKSSILPDVVLDSSLAVGNENKSEVVQETPSGEIQGGDHDYSVRQKDKALLVNVQFGDDDILDINSMPVVMADAVITDEPSTSQVPLVNIQMPKIDLVPNPNSTNTHTVVLSDGRLEMPPSAQSVVKAVRASTADRSKPAVKTVSVSQVSGALTKVANRAGSNISKPQSAEKLTPARGARLLQQGIASGKYVIVQPTGTAQPRLTPKSNTPQQITSMKAVAGNSQQQINVQSPGSGKLVIITKPQSGGQQQVLTALTPAQQKALVAGGKLPPPPQRLLTSTGQLLTPVNPRNVMPKGTKLTPATGQQMRTIATASGKQTLGPKLQMQSLQTKIILPTMETVKMPHTQPQPVVRMVATGKPQSNTILIQATQGSSVLSSIVSKVSTSTSQLSPRLTLQPKQRPRLLTSATMLQQAAGNPAPILPSSPKVQQTKQIFQPRMLLQKSRPAMLGNVRSEVQPGSPVPKLVPHSQVISQATQAQVSKQFTTKSTVESVQKPIQTRLPLLGSKTKATTARPAVQKTASNSSSSIPRTNTVELMTTQALPPLAPMHLTATCSNEVLSLSQAPSMPLPSFQASGSEQLVPSSTATPGDAPAPTYMLLTIDEAGNLQPYNSQSLISYDGTDQAGQTIYIDGLESGGDLDNIILTIGGNSSSLALDMEQTNTMTNVSSIYNTRAPSSSQDILAAALANTDVFQSEVPLQDTLTVVSSNRSSVMTPCVVESSVMLTSPPSSLRLPSLNRAADVSETSLTLNQPIMTPLEVPSMVVPTRASVPVSFPIDLPLTVTQSLSVPMSSYTVMNENMATTESIFQPSMPLLSEEISDACTTTSSHLPHDQITYNAVQEHSELSPYSDTIQIVQDDVLPRHKRLLYQSQLATQTLDNVQCAQQSNTFFNRAPSEESHCPTSTMSVHGTISAEISQGTSGISNLLMPSSKALDTSAEMYKVPNSLPPVSSANSSETCQTKDVCTEDISVLDVQPLEDSNSQIPKFLHTQTESNTAQHSFNNNLQTIDCPDPTVNALESGSSHSNIIKSSEDLDDGIGTINVLTSSQQNESHTDRVSILDEAKNASYVSVASNISHPELSVMGSNIVNLLDIPLPPPRTTTEPVRNEPNVSPHSSMPLLVEDVSANSKKQLEDYENSEALRKSSLNETGFGKSDR